MSALSADKLGEIERDLEEWRLFLAQARRRNVISAIEEQMRLMEEKKSGKVGTLENKKEPICSMFRTLEHVFCLHVVNANVKPSSIVDSKNPISANGSSVPLISPTKKVRLRCTDQE